MLFINTVYQSALWHQLHHPGGSYRPGDLFSLSLGLKEVTLGFWSPQLQVNVIDRRHDQGELADSLGLSQKF